MRDSLAPKAFSVAEPREQRPRLVPEAPSSWGRYSERQRWGLLAVLFLVTTSNYFDYFILSVLLEPIKREFQVSDTLLGLLSGAGFALVYAVAGLPVAQWADRGNRRTIITVTLAGWSVMTTLCAMARSFWSLALARFGVGAFEPGAAPAAQSLVVEYFPPERRALAIAFLTMGASAVGYLCGVSLGGYIAAGLGWRAAFIFAGIGGLLLALVAQLTLAEPRLPFGALAGGLKAESLGRSLAALRSKRSFVLVLVGQSVSTVFATAASVFFPSFMIRSLHATIGQVSGSWGTAVAAADLLGGLAGGWLADHLGREDIRWYTWLPALTSALAIPLYGLALASDHLTVFVATDFAAEFIFSIGLPPVFAAVHAVCGDRRRAIAIAVLQLFFYLVGMGFGPSLAGTLSDEFSATRGMESLRYSLYVMLAFLPPAAVAFYWAARTMRADQEVAGLPAERLSVS